MKQLAQYQDGRLEIQEVPEPQAPPGGIVVRTTHSVISPGTEKMKVEQAKMNLLQKARARPDQVKKVLDTAKTLGWKSAIEKVRNRLESPTPLGYSASGVVEALDEGNTRFRIGDRVAVAGAECANHAEVLAIPNLLAAKIPEGVENWQGAYTTLAAISLQAVRQSNLEIGDYVLVMGQGLVGLLATSLAVAGGARVMAVDYDSSRLKVAEMIGAERSVNPKETSLADAVREWTGGDGVDRVLLCIGGKDPGPAELAYECVRDRGTVVIVGIYDAPLQWKQYYMKEIDVRYSRSYGPGRYDPKYEWGGEDYPIGYVRWTEGRNFDACLSLMRDGKLPLELLTTRRVKFADCVDVYASLLESAADIGVVLEYSSSPEDSLVTDSSGREVTVDVVDRRPGSKVAAIDVIGAGNFAKTMLLPHLKGEHDLGVIVNATALSSRHVKEKFGFEKAETDSKEVFKMPDERAVVIGTRHHLHAPLVLKGLAANRHVFVEKPLCLLRSEMVEIDSAYKDSQGTVMIGFNRRFAPATKKVRSLIGAAPGPAVCAFHVCAGKLDPEHWYANYEESGGRVLGEACHFFDFFCHLFDSKPVGVTAQPTWSTGGAKTFPDSISAQVEFEDGSCGQLIYSAEGDSSYPKEVFTVYAAGLTARCENFQSLSIHRGRKESKSKYTSKGHQEEMMAWSAFLKGNAAHPLPYHTGRQSMELTFAALDSIRENRTIILA